LRLSGDVSLRIGQTIPLTVTLPNKESLFVVASIVRWMRGEEYGLETSDIEKLPQSRLEHYVKRLAQGEAHAETLRPIRLTI